MKRFLLAIISFFVLAQSSWAHHIIGGEMRYTYLGSGAANSKQYKITMLLFRGDDPNGAPLDPSYIVAIYSNDNGQKINGTAGSTGNNWEMFMDNPPGIQSVPIIFPTCIQDPPILNYTYASYSMIVDLPNNSTGYTIVFQTCCRADNMINVGNNEGATYNCVIPGSSQLNGGTDSSPQFNIPLNVICWNSHFTLNFGAIDPDGDSLVYSLCNAYDGGAAINSGFDDPAPPPYNSVMYISPYNGSTPLGLSATIDSHTGVISGIAPGLGKYVVCVCIQVFRNGVFIGTHRKDLIVEVFPCQVPTPTLLQPTYLNCKDFTVSFQNLTPSPLINSYYWDFGVSGTLADTSNLPSPTFTYPDTGVYVVKLVVNRNQNCSDSTTSLVRVFPGFTPNFIFTGVCINNPTQFTDASVAAYGIVNTWNWSFGDGGTATTRNPQHSYTTAGAMNVQLIVTSNKGCVDTARQVVNMIDKPLITLAFRDTLICIPDQLQLNASGQGVFSWTPLTNIINANTGTPTVNPTTTTTYHVTLNDNSCINNDSVRVRVVGSVSLQARPDTTICGGDPAQLGAQTDGLTYSWTPTATLNDPTLLNPIATPPTTTTYTLITRIGSCSATDNMTVKVVPYPGSNAGPDDTICYNTSTRLTGNIVGSSFSWSPTNSMINANTLNPTVYPPRTTAYVLTVYDVLGCPKPGRDTIVVTVMPKMHPFAGRDTSVVIGQPLQFNGTGGLNYSWSPSTGLSAINIPNPIGIYSSEMPSSIRYKVVVADSAGCLDSAYVNVKIYKTGPKIFVPTAFTPNGDGLNDVIRPIAVGIQSIEYFSIYNRWGQLVFTTTINGQGWDGKIGNKEQGTNVFVWMVKAIDYLGKPYFAKGTVTLIR